jgi:hypothetical protein
MPKGGHAHSGPAKNPNSRTSERAGYTLTALPNEGYRGTVPDLADFLIEPTGRHEEIWTELWSTPQACAWSQERWRWPTVADLVMFRVRADDPESPVGLATSIRQLRDDLGLSAAGLAANGWAIAAPVIAPTESEQPADGDEVGQKRQRRLRGGDAQ